MSTAVTAVRAARSSLALVAALAWVVGCGNESSTPLPPKDCSTDPVANAFVVLPDTQFYSCAYPDTFEEQAQWIVAERQARKFGIVLHTGDIVDTPTSHTQWAAANKAMHLLDREIPYLLVPGNHDLDSTRHTELNDFFTSDDEGNGECTDIETKTPGKLENAYAVVQLGGRDWIFVGLEFTPRDATLEWANQVLAAHATMPAVLFTHAYLFSDNTRYDRAIQPLQKYHPDAYKVTPAEGINDGQDIWETVVEPNPNVQLVLSGHVIPDGTARSVAMREDGSVVHEILANYQQCDTCPCEEVEGGGGYLRILELRPGTDAGDPRNVSIHVSTYSPHLDASLTDAENEFDLALELPAEN